MNGEFHARLGRKFPADLRSQCNGCAHEVISEHGDPLRWAKLYFSKFLAAVISGSALSVASVRMEDEDGTVFEGDSGWLSRCEALVEQVETRLGIVVWDRFADGLPGGAMGSKVSMSKGGSGGGGR